MKVLKKNVLSFRLRVPARASLFYALAGLISRGLGLIFTPIFTRALSAGDYGIYALFLGWETIFSAFATLEIGSGAIFCGFARFSGREGDFLKSAFFALILAFSVLVLPVGFIIWRVSGLDLALIALMAVSVLCDAVSSLYLTYKRYSYKFVTVFIFNTLPAVFMPLLSLILIKKSPYFARPLGYFVLSVISLLAVLILWRWRGKKDGDMVRYTLVTCLAILPGFLSSTVLTSADRLIIGARLGAEAVAKYSVAHSLGLALTFFTAGIYGALKPWITRKLKGGEDLVVWRVCGKILSLGAVGTLLLASLAPELFRVLAPIGYSEALSEIYPLSLAVLPMFLASVYSSVLTYRGRGWLVSAVSIGAAAVSLALNLLLVGRFSYTVSALVFLISYVLLAAVLGYLENGKIRGALSIFFVCGFGVLALYLLKDDFYVRLFCLIPLLILGFFAVKSLIKEVKET